MDVVFDAELFRSIYAGFRDVEKVTDEALQNCFDIASEIVGNANSCVPYDPQNNIRTRETVLNLVTCHIATMMYLWDDAQSGSVSSATQGSVSVSFDNAKSPEWWGQTKCGATAWVILKRYRSGLIFYGLKTIPMGG